MIALIQKFHRPLFYLAWLSVSLIQASGTGLLDDEAYYWVYSRFPDWGYFDHPPAVAMLIKWGYALSASPFGVRLFIVLMSTATIAMIHALLTKKNDRLFYVMASSILFLQVGGILSVPDIPLMFFVALYFLILRDFLQKSGWLNSILLGLVIACMLYSKYHGVLVVLFTLLAKPRLLLKAQTWTAAGIAAILFLPHILWQISHGLPSVSYHLFERNASSYKFNFTIEYIFGQIALAGPFIGWLLLYGAMVKKSESDFERILKWTTNGIFLVFLLATFKGRAEANWTVPAYIGLIVLSHDFLSDRTRLSVWVERLMWPALSIAIIVRIYMLLDVKPLPWLKKDEFHKTAEWAQIIQDKAKGLPVVFPDSYQRASQYWFYTGDTSYSLNTIQYRRNNYNFWPLEQRLQGRKVFVAYPIRDSLFRDSLPTPKKALFTTTIDSFYSYAQVNIREITSSVVENKQLRAHLQAQAPRISIRPGTQIFLVLYDDKNAVAHLLPANILLINILDPSASGVAVADLNAVKPGTYRYKWAVQSAIPGKPTLNSTSATLNVE